MTVEKNNIKNRDAAKAEAAYERQKIKYKKDCEKIAYANSIFSYGQIEKRRNIEKKLIDARKAFEIARFKSVGIEIGKSVVLYHSTYTSPLAMKRYVVILTPDGYVDLRPVTKSGKIMWHRSAKYAPCDLNKLICTKFEVNE